MNDEEELETGLDVLRDTVGDMAEEDDESGGGPLTAAVEQSLAGAAPTRVERPVREMLMRELEEARNRLVAKPAAPSSPLDRLIERFGGPTGKSGSLLVARRERAAEQAKKDEERRADLLTLLSKQEQLESADINEQDRIAAARAKAAGGSKGYELPYLQDMRSRLIQERSSLDPRNPRFLDLNKRIQEIDIRIEYLGGQRAKGGDKPSLAQAAIDKKFGEEYANWIFGGAGVQSAARIAKINDSVTQLQSREDISGPVVGYTLENLPTVASVVYPEAQDVKDVVESVVQTDLRAILGGQFAQKEGEALIKRAYNPRLKEEQNIKRLQLLAMQMQKVGDEKNRAMKYFGENETMRGYQFAPYTADDFLTPDQLRRLDAGESVESILDEKSAPEREPASTETQSSTSVPDFMERAKREQEKRNRERNGRQ
jgi:hypothetical protein